MDGRAVAAPGSATGVSFGRRQVICDGTSGRGDAMARTSITDLSHTAPLDSREAIARIRDERLSQSPPVSLAQIIRLAGGEAEAQRGRWLLEVAQNTEDALHRAGAAAGKLAVVQHGADLLLANDGDPFTLHDVYALVAPGLSGKGRPDATACPVCGISRAETIGHKGIGFSATRELSDEVCVSSGRAGRYLRFRMAPRDVWPLYQARWRPEIAAAKDQNFWRNVELDAPAPEGFPALAPLDWPEVPEIVEELHARYRTVFLFPGGAPDAEAARELVTSLERDVATALLFFDHLSSVRLELEDGSHLLSVEEGPAPEVEGWRSKVLRRDDEETEWLLCEDAPERAPEVLLPRGAPRRVSRAVAVPAQPEETGRLCVHYPTEQPSGSAIHLHGDFRTDPARRNVDRDHPLNRWMIERFETFFVDRVVPGLVALARRGRGPAWLLRVLAHEPRTGDVAQRFWERLLPALRTQPVVPGVRRGTLTYGPPDDAVCFPRGATEGRADLLPGGLHARRLVPVELTEGEEVAALLERLGVRRLSARDLDDLRRALEASPPTSVAQARDLLEALQRVLGPVWEARVQEALRALPVFPYEAADGSVAFTSATRLGPKEPGVRIWLNADKVPPPPRGEARRHALLHRDLQFDATGDEREVAAWLRTYDIVDPQEGRPLVVEIGRAMVAEWTEATGGGGGGASWEARWRRFHGWALDIFLMAATPPTQEQRAALRAMPLPAMQEGASIGLRRIRDLLLPETDTEALRRIDVPRPDLARLEAWFQDETRERKWREEHEASLLPGVLWAVFGLPSTVSMVRVELEADGRQRQGLPAAPLLGPRALTEDGRRLQDRAWRDWRLKVRDAFGRTDPFIRRHRLVFLPGWVFDVLARSHREKLEALYRVLDETWTAEDDHVLLKGGQRDAYRPWPSPAASALASLPWVPCTDGTVRVPGETVHLRGAGPDLVTRLLPAVPSDSYGPFDRMLGVRDLKEVATLAWAAEGLVDRFPQGGSIIERNDWVRTVHTLLERLSSTLEVGDDDRLEEDPRRLLRRLMPRVLARVDGRPEARPWAEGLVYGVPRALKDVLRFREPVFYFGPERLEHLLGVLGARPFSARGAPPSTPAWEDLPPLETPALEALRDLVTIVAVMRGRRGKQLARARTFELRVAPGLQIDGQEVPFHLLDRRRFVSARGNEAKALQEAFRDIDLPFLVGLDAMDLDRARRDLAVELELDPSQLREVLEEGLAEQAPDPVSPPADTDDGSPMDALLLPSVGEYAEDEEAADAGDEETVGQAPLDEEALTAAVAQAARGGDLAMDAPPDPSPPSGPTGRDGQHRRTPRRPNVRLGREAERACFVHLKTRYPELAVHDVHRIRFYGADFLLTGPEAPPPPKGDREAATAYLREEVVRFVECKGTLERSPSQLLFTETERKMATFAKRMGRSYEVEVWTLAEREGRYFPVLWRSAPASLLERLQLVNATYALPLREESDAAEG